MALATTKRVGELHALSKVIATQGKDLNLSYLPEFIAKTETTTNPILREFHLRSLSSVVGVSLATLLKILPSRAEMQREFGNWREYVSFFMYLNQKKTTL